MFGSVRASQPGRYSRCSELFARDSDRQTGPFTAEPPLRLRCYLDIDPKDFVAARRHRVEGVRVVEDEVGATLEAVVLPTFVAVYNYEALPPRPVP